MFILRQLEKLVYSLRDSLWIYPELVFVDKNSFWFQLRSLYHTARPVSHYLFYGLLTVVFFAYASSHVSAVLRVNTDILHEGVIVGVDENGQLQRLSRINPLINTNIQLEQDLIELIYDDLIIVNQDGESIGGLADYGELEKGKLYRFRLYPDRYWHDGQKVTTADVEATFNLLQMLEEDPVTSTLHSRAVSKMEMNVLDEYSFELKLNSVIPGFFEAVGFKVLPAHLIAELDTRNIVTSDPVINRNPVGTGPFRFGIVDDDSITLTANPDYPSDTGSIREIHFHLYPDENSAISALRGGKIHTLPGVSLNKLRELEQVPNLQIYESSVIYNQYWGMYFNLNDEGPAAFDDINVRRAISSAINRERIIETLLGYAVEAKGAIPPDSWAHVVTSGYLYDAAKARELLEEAGWKIPDGDTVRQKDGTRLSFKLLLVDNADRSQLARSIQQDLADVGIEVTIEAKPKEQVVSEHIVPRVFDALLYGVETFDDPDRYELFHSSQIEHPGINISSYASIEKVLTVREGKQERIPEVDDLLDDARSLIEQDERKQKYEIFQTIIAREVPVVFLFHPKEVYMANKRVNGIRLDNIETVEERFRNISEWTIKAGST